MSYMQLGHSVKASAQYVYIWQTQINFADLLDEK